MSSSVLRLQIGSPLAGLLLVAACINQSASSSDGGADGSLPANINRSPTCRSYQVALCDYLAGRCGQVTRAICDEEAQSLYCRSDTSTQACIDELRVADCSGMPAACDNVTDPAPAVYVCGRLVNKICGRVAGCGLVWADCAGTGTGVLDCDSAIGMGPSIDACMLELDTHPCSELDVRALPASCLGVVTF